MPGPDSTLVPHMLEYYQAKSPIVDFTYGKGRFWQSHRPAGLITMDLLPAANIQADNRHTPLRNGSAGTVIYDPPHIERENEGSVHGIYNLAAWDGDFSASLLEAWRVLKPGGLVIAKIGDNLTEVPWNDQRFLADALAIGFTPYDRVIKSRHLSVRNPEQGQYRARKKHCFFLILRKGDGVPQDRPIRRHPKQGVLV